MFFFFKVCVCGDRACAQVKCAVMSFFKHRHPAKCVKKNNDKDQTGALGSKHHAVPLCRVEGPRGGGSARSPPPLRTRRRKTVALAAAARGLGGRRRTSTATTPKEGRDEGHGVVLAVVAVAVEGSKRSNRSRAVVCSFSLRWGGRGRSCVRSGKVRGDVIIFLKTGILPSVSRKTTTRTKKEIFESIKLTTT